jgi:DNA-binding MarR family transcriptional regulator
MARPRVNLVYGSRLGETWRATNIGRLLFTAAQLFERDIIETVHGLGFPDVRIADLVLFRSLDLDGTRLTDLASRASMTKQGMKELVDQAEDLGLVSRCPDDDDGRAKIVKLTPRGLKMMAALHKGVTHARKQMADILGRHSLDVLNEILSEYLRGRGEMALKVGTGRPLA